MERSNIWHNRPTGRSVVRTTRRHGGHGVVQKAGTSKEDGAQRSRETNQLYQDAQVPMASAAKTMPNRPRAMQDGASGARRSPGFLRAADNYKEVRFIHTLTTAEKERALGESNVPIPSLSLFTAVRQFKPKSTPLAQPSFFSRFS